MTEYDFLSHGKIGDRMYVVRECFGDPDQLFNMYVLVGEDKAAVIDSGMGVTGSLRQYIEENITDKKPVVSYATHGDLDHIGSAVLFDEQYMSYHDLRKLDWNLNVERRFSDLGVFCNNDPVVLEFCKDKYVHNENLKFKDVKDGEIIELGQITLEAVWVPGHSYGSMVYLDHEHKCAFVGDAISEFNAWQRCTDYEECLQAYEKLLRKLPEDCTLYNGHGSGPVSRSMLLDMIQGFHELLDGKVEKDVHVEGWKFPMVDPEELEYEMYHHHTGGIILNYNARVLPHRRNGEKG